MITKKEWDSYPETKQDELSENAFSYRQCEKCLNYAHLGESEDNKAEGMYLHSYCFDCSDEDIEKYEKKHNIDINDNVFCLSCVEEIYNDLEKQQGGNNE